jgi:hypothetical protein
MIARIENVRNVILELSEDFAKHTHVAVLEDKPNHARIDTLFHRCSMLLGEALVLMRSARRLDIDI